MHIVVDMKLRPHSFHYVKNIDSILESRDKLNWLYYTECKKKANFIEKIRKEMWFKLFYDSSTSKWFISGIFRDLSKLSVGWTIVKVFLPEHNADSEFQVGLYVDSWCYTGMFRWRHLALVTEQLLLFVYIYQSCTIPLGLQFCLCFCTCMPSKNLRKVVALTLVGEPFYMMDFSNTFCPSLCL